MNKVEIVNEITTVCTKLKKEMADIERDCIPELMRTTLDPTREEEIFAQIESTTERLKTLSAKLAADVKERN